MTQKGFGLIENLVVTVMGAIFILLFVHGTLIVIDRFYSVQNVTDFDEDRKILRAQVLTWSTAVFTREVYLSNEFLQSQGVVSDQADYQTLPYAGSFGSGFVMKNHAIVGSSFVSSTGAGPVNGYDVVFLLMRSPRFQSVTVTDDPSAKPGFPGNPGLYRMNIKEPYLYVHRDADNFKVGDYVAMNSVGGTAFARLATKAGRRLGLSFSGMGVFRPEEAAMAADPDSPIGNTESPMTVFYKGGSVLPFDIVFIGVSLDEVNKPKLVMGTMTPSESNPFRIDHRLNLPVESLRLLRGDLTTIPGGTFIPFETPQQLAASLTVPSFLTTRLNGAEGLKLFDQQMTFLVPL